MFSRDMFRLVLQLTNTRYPTTKSHKNVYGVLTTSKKEQIRIWEKYYKELLSATDEKQKAFPSVLLSCPDTPVITSAKYSLKSNKYPGPDNTQLKLLKVERTIIFPSHRTFLVR